MFQYLILRQFIRNVPPKLSFWNTPISAWTTPRRGNLRGVKFPEPTNWKPDSNKNKHSDDTVNTVSDDEELKFETHDGNDFSDRNDDDENNIVSHDDAINYN